MRLATVDNCNTNETWMPVVGYENAYEVSDLGNVRRIGTGRGVKTGRVLSLAPHNAGYLSANLWKENKGNGHLVHRLVAHAFIGEISSFEVNHINGNKHDNRLVNLEIVTRQENITHAIKHGLIDNWGANNPSGKLSVQQVEEIRAKYTPYEHGYKSLAKEYGVSWEAIRNIIKRKVWNNRAAEEI